MRSMTGFGAASGESSTARIVVEVRSVNQRHLDVRIALPREYASWERDLRERVRVQVERGRVDVTVVRTPVAGRRRYQVMVREELAARYVAAARALGRRLRLPGSVSLADVLRLPDLFEVVERSPELDGELKAFTREREREGRHLRQDMARRAAVVNRLVQRIRTRVPRVQREVARRAQERLARVTAEVGIDPARVAQELAPLVERGDVTEELVRLESHLAALGEALRGSASAGKRIEFLLQEILRELNTTGAKAADAETSGWVLEAKGEVEKLREQVQNVE